MGSPPTTTAIDIRKRRPVAILQDKSEISSRPHLSRQRNFSRNDYHTPLYVLRARRGLSEFKQLHQEEAYSSVRLRRENSRYARQKSRQALLDYKDYLAEGSRRLKSLSLQCKLNAEKKLEALQSSRARHIKLRPTHTRTRSDQHSSYLPEVTEFTSPESDIIQIKVNIKRRNFSSKSASTMTQTDS
jgi:hypothetical protein